jgi:EsV-1-7 cysteine-rich motif
LQLACLTLQVPRYCTRHSVDKDDVVSLRTSYCIADGCIKRPLFGSAGDRQALYCTEHAREHPEKALVKVKSKTCEVTTCTARPGYGYSTDNVLRRCKAHILPGMTNVTHRYCESCNQRIKGVGYNFDNDKVCLESYMCSALLRSDCIATVETYTLMLRVIVM